VNSYLPEYFKEFELISESRDTYTIHLPKENPGKAGQFYMLSSPGIGEAPISVASGHLREMLFTIRSVGTVTSKLPDARVIGVRGPYGTSWPWERYGKILAVAGGIGIPPINSLFDEMVGTGRGKDLEIIYGARSPSDLIYHKQRKEWAKMANVIITVDKGDPNWKGNVGFVTQFISKAETDRDGAVFIIGPPLMMKNSVAESLEAGFRPENIYLSLERRMECGIGVCGHCNVGEFYACEDGPIFQYSAVKHLPELFL
jgi:NAD(P)H-flavin reductase